MPALPPATGVALAERARELLRDAAELTSGADPNYIRDAQPESLFEAIPLAAARQGCRRYADNPDEYSGRRQARVERACRPYLDDIGYGQPPALALPFRGGQCPGVLYRVEFSATNDNGSRFTVEQIVGGPVIGTFVDPPDGLGRRAAGIVASLTNGSTVKLTQITLQDPATNPNPALRVVRREDNGPDDCGNPVPVIEPPVPPPTPGPIREPFTRPPDIDIDIDVEINPDLTIDVDFGTGPVTIDPFGDGGEGGDGGAGGAPPGDVGEPGSPEETGPNGDAEGEAPEGTVLTGLRIDFVEPPIGGKEYAPGVFRGVCYVYMGTAEGLDHDPAGAMLRDGQFVYAEKDNLTRWSVSANRGYNLRVTPYYRAVEAEE